MFSRLFRSGRKSRKPRRRKPVCHRYRPVLEVLEARVVLATRTWTGDSPLGDDWSDRFNWLGDKELQRGDDLVFPANPANLTSEEDLCHIDDSTDSDTFNSITISGTGYLLTSNNNSDPDCEGINAEGPLLVKTTNTTGFNFVDIKIKNSVTFDIAAGGTLFYGGTLEGGASLTKNGAGVLNLRGANDYSGPTRINDGVLRATYQFDCHVTFGL